MNHSVSNLCKERFHSSCQYYAFLGSTTLNIGATYEKNKVFIKFDSSDRFTNHFNISINSSSLVHLKITISDENQIQLFCPDINFVKVVTVQVIASRIVNGQTYKSKTLFQSVNTHCEKPNLSKFLV